MTVSSLLLVTSVGSAALALWCHVRWPRLAPQSLTGSILRLLVALGALQLGVVALHAAASVSSSAAVAAFVGVIVPVLGFAFLAALWLMKLFADALRGYV